VVPGSDRRQPETGELENKPCKERSMMQIELVPQLTRAKITEINDTAVKVSIQGRLGVITVPLRWILTDKALEAGQEVEFYFSYMNVR
jgi:hypothetical protein